MPVLTSYLELHRLLNYVSKNIVIQIYLNSEIILYEFLKELLLELCIIFKRVCYKNSIVPFVYNYISIDLSI